MDGWTDGRTDRQMGRRTERQTDLTKLIAIFRNLANTPKNTSIIRGPTGRRIRFQATPGCSII